MQQHIEPLGRNQPAHGEHRFLCTRRGFGRHRERQRVWQADDIAARLQRFAPALAVPFRQHHDLPAEARREPPRHLARRLAKILVEMAVLPRDMVQAQANGGGQHEQREHGVDLHQHLGPVRAAMVADAGHGGQVCLLERRPLRKQRFMPDTRIERELAVLVPQAQNGHVMAERGQRIGERRRHAFGAGHGVQRAGQEADVAAGRRGMRGGGQGDLGDPRCRAALGDTKGRGRHPAAARHGAHVTLDGSIVQPAMLKLA
ncbi:hypothetical protein D9M69_437300 [compost metagenome]